MRYILSTRPCVGAGGLLTHVLSRSTFLLQLCMHVQYSQSNTCNLMEELAVQWLLQERLVHYIEHAFVLPHPLYFEASRQVKDMYSINGSTYIPT